MKLLLTIDALGDRSIDVSDDATVGDLLDSLVATEQAAGRRHPFVDVPGGLVVERTGQVLAPETPTAKSNIRSGDRVRLVGLDEAVRLECSSLDRSAPIADRPAAWVKLLTGPMANTVIEVSFGDSTIGRGRDNDVVITDDAMSLRHAVITVDDHSITVTDLASTNGVITDRASRNEALTRSTTLLPGRRVLLGTTWIEIEHCRRTRGLADVDGPAVEFNRPPRLVPPFEAPSITLPEPPDHPGRVRLPMITALVPLLMAGVLVYSPVLFGGEPNFRYGLFMLFSPLMIVGSFWERKRSGRADFKQALKTFRADLAAAEADLQAAQIHEQRGRLRAAPSITELDEAVDALSPRLWERAVGDTDTFSLRVGLADQPSLVEIVDNGRGPADLRREVDELPDRFATVPRVPALADMRVHGGIGVSGTREYVTPLCYSLVGQVATLHSPAEVLLAAMVPPDARSDWEWMKWLPHCPADDSPLGGHHLAAGELECRNLLGRLLDIVDQRAGQHRGGLDPNRSLTVPCVVVVIAEGVPVVQHELTRLLSEGPTVGVFPLWISGASRRVPRPIGNVIDIAPDGSAATLAFAGSRSDRAHTPIITDIEIETLSETAIIDLARRLAPIEDVSARFTQTSAIPDLVSLVDLLGGSDILESTAPLLQRWEGRPKHLEAPVGRTADGVFTLDIRRDGPHGLVGGTTGAGKSEFLQSWIMAMAASFSPETVNFLLVDYKGGAAFKDCSRLPHSVGMVTDLDPAGIRRALVSLGAEVRRRELIQDEHNCSSLLDMIDRGIAEAPPSLLIIVDEFAALVQEVPEFIEGMVDIAQRGRSLGVHLVLATQRPAGVITGQIKANTDLRIALRTSDKEDSVDVIETPDAADIDRRTPGRAISRIGRQRTQFQSAYVGGITDAAAVSGPEVTVGTFTFDGIVPLDPPDSHRRNEMAGATDLERLVDNIGAAHRRSARPMPRRPWLDPLGSAYDLETLFDAAAGTAVDPTEITDDGASLPIGIVDVPDDQAQVPFTFRLDIEGSLGIIGAGGAGKTVALRTIAVAAALSVDDPTDAPIVYGLDFAGRGLQMLEPLPHVAGIVADDEPERIQRVLSTMEAELNERTRLFSEARASSFTEYRRGSGEHIVRRLLLIDGYPSFHELYSGVERDRWVNLVRRLVVEGRQFGLHVVLTAPRRETVYSTVARSIGRWLVLRQTSSDDYRSLEVPVDLLGDEPPPGRAIHQRRVGQVAVLGGRPDTESQVQAMLTLADEMERRGFRPAPPIRLLPADVDRRAFVHARAVGLLDRDFSEWTLPERFRVFLVAGPRSSGRTTALLTIGAAAAQGPDGGPDRDLDVVVLSAKPQALPIQPLWRAGVGDAEVRPLVDELLASAGSPSGRRTLVLIDDANALVDAGVALSQLVDAADGERLQVVIVMDDTKARSNFDAFSRSVRASRLGLLLRPSPLEDKEVYGLPLPRVASHLWPAGRGYIVSDQSVETIQLGA
ncbi:MAG: FtsK/SpoIIIE domain-containing protein [Acidimicrobiia bacterium]|nr:FtsK/SpoIIIE domain-containing protein [Acidimicrobiia bacterium]